MDPVLYYSYTFTSFTWHMDPTTATVLAILVAAGSEIITLLPIKENSWVQLIIKALKVVFPKR